MTVGVADLQCSTNPRATITTVALGSCLGITCYDPVRQAGGLLHAMLPRAAKYQESAPVEAMYVDTGLSTLVSLMVKIGSHPRQCEFKVFGGAQIMRSCEYFRIGEQNIATMQSLVLEHRLNVAAWEIGGQLNRSITLRLENGMVELRMPNCARRLV